MNGLNESTVDFFNILFLFVIPIVTGLIAFFQRKSKHWPPKTAADYWKGIGIPLLIGAGAGLIMFFAYSLILFIAFENAAGGMI